LEISPADVKYHTTTTAGFQGIGNWIKTEKETICEFCSVELVLSSEEEERREENV